MIRWTCNRCGFSGLYSGNPGQEIHCRSCRAPATIRRPTFGGGELVALQADAPTPTTTTTPPRHAITLPPKKPILIAAGATAAIVFLLLIVFCWWPSGNPQYLITNPDAQQQEVAAAVGLLVPTLETTLPNGKRVENPIAWGTCFIVTPDGTAITSAHVVQKAHDFADAPLKSKLEKELTVWLKVRFWVFLQNEQIAAEVVTLDEQSDVAILRVQRQGPGPFFRLGAAKELQRGLGLLALGFPLTARQPLLTDEQPASLESEDDARKFVGQAATEQVGTRLRQHFSARDLGYVQTKGTITRLTRDGSKLLVEHDAKTNPGSSGGPVVTEDGRVVAVTFAKDLLGSDMSHAIAIDDLKTWILKHAPGSSW